MRTTAASSRTNPSDDVYPPLIDREQFNRIQERMKRRRISNQAHPKEVYLLSGKIHCGLCGRAYCGERKTNGKGIVLLVLL